MFLSYVYAFLIEFISSIFIIAHSHHPTYIMLLPRTELESARSNTGQQWHNDMSVIGLCT